MRKALIKFDKPGKFLEVKTCPLNSYMEIDACFLSFNRKLE